MKSAESKNLNTIPVCAVLYTKICFCIRNFLGEIRNEINKRHTGKQCKEIS